MAGQAATPHPQMSRADFFHQQPQYSTKKQHGLTTKHPPRNSGGYVKHNTATSQNGHHKPNLYDTNTHRRPTDPPIYPRTSRLRESTPRSRSNRRIPAGNTILRRQPTEARRRLHSPHHPAANNRGPGPDPRRHGPVLLQLLDVARGAGNLPGGSICAA